MTVTPITRPRPAGPSLQRRSFPRLTCDQRHDRSEGVDAATVRRPRGGRDLMNHPDGRDRHRRHRHENERTAQLRRDYAGGDGIRELVTGLSGMLSIPERAHPDDYVEVHRQLGVSLTHHPSERAVVAEAVPTGLSKEVVPEGRIDHYAEALHRRTSRPPCGEGPGTERSRA